MKPSQQVAIKAPPHVDFVFGYPGVPATRPRLVGTVELRSNGLKPIDVSYVSISLNQYEKILAPSKSGAPLGLTATKYVNHRVIGKEVKLFQARIGELYEKVTSLDLPFIIEIPSAYEDLPAASLILPGGICETSYQLVATLHQAQMAAVRVAAPINIERFDNLSTWDIFQVPKMDEVMGLDHVARMTVALPVTCVGPLDPINVLVNISPNPDHPKARKIKVSRLQITIEEILSFKPSHECEPIIKRKRIVRHELECGGVKLDSTGIAREIRTQFPCKAIQDIKVGIVDSSQLSSPLPMGFTTNSVLYSIDYDLTIRAYLSGAKDLISSQPIHICSWDARSCVQIMESIDKASRTERRRQSVPEEGYLPRNRSGKRIVVD